MERWPRHCPICGIWSDRDRILCSRVEDGRKGDLAIGNVEEEDTNWSVSERVLRHAHVACR